MVIQGVLFLGIFIAAILFLRNKVNTGDNPMLKTAQKIGDASVWIRFIGGIILVIFVFGILTIFAKKH